MKRAILIFSIIAYCTIFYTCGPGLCCNTDSPTCQCFVSNTSSGAWDPSGTWIQDVAVLTVGTIESCGSDAGQPYYQMRLGMNSENGAHFAACLMDVYSGDFDSSWDRQAWCSEAVSYWHRQAGIPYATGYRNSTWNMDWQLIGSGSIRNFYQTEEATGGRGRWIDVMEMDPADFQPGINAPVPGAYMRITAFRSGSFDESDPYNHSLMVDSMTIYKDRTGYVHQVRVSFIEGNSGNQVKNTRVLDSLFAYTPGGNNDFGSDRKVYGFGIDLDEYGSEIYDPNRLKIIEIDPPLTHRYWKPTKFIDPWSKIYHAIKWKEHLDYVRLISEGPKVIFSAGDLGQVDIPNGDDFNWKIPLDLFKSDLDQLEITVDLLDEYPTPIKGILIEWTNDYLPQGYQVLWAGTNKEFKEAKVPQISIRNLDVKPESGIPIPIVFGTESQQVRYVKLIFPKSSIQKDAILNSLSFKYDWGPDDDAELNPIPGEKGQ